MAGFVPQVTLFTPDYRRVAPINFWVVEVVVEVEWFVYAGVGGVW